MGATDEERMWREMLTAFRVILLVCLGLDFFGCVAGNKDEQRRCLQFFGVAGVLFILSYLA